MKKIKILVCRVGQAPEVQEVEDPWKFTKELIGEGSLIEVTRLDDGAEVFSDEEGMLKDLPLNRVIPAVGKKIPPGWDFVVKSSPNLCEPGETGWWTFRGDFIITRHDPHRDAPLSLLDEDIEKYTKLFAGQKS